MSKVEEFKELKKKLTFRIELKGKNKKGYIPDDLFISVLGDLSFNNNTHLPAGMVLDFVRWLIDAYGLPFKEDTDVKGR